MGHLLSPLGSESIQDLNHVLFDVMNDGVIVVDRRGAILDCNRAFHQRLGYEKPEVVGRSVRSLDPPEFAAKVEARMTQILADGQATFETAHIRKDGSVMPVEISARFFNLGGEVVFLSIVRDISERKALEAGLKEGLEVYQAAINTPALGFWMVDTRGRFLDVNAAYLAQSGFSRKELLAMRIQDIEAAERPEETAAHMERVMARGHDRFRSMHRRKDGTVWPVEVVTSYSGVRGGRFFVFVEDITEKAAQESRLELASRVFETMEQAVVITDAENRIVSMNPAATSITGYTLEEVRGKNPRVFASGRHDPTFYAEMWEALNTAGHWEGEIWDRRKDGAVYAKWMTINTVCDPQGNVDQYVSVFSDITDRKRNEEMIWRQANFDSLTGLPNRQLLHERLERALKTARRNDTSLAVFFIDLDNFKQVNDTLGHAKGDDLLVEAARRIAEQVRDTDTIARLGGDEFTVILPDCGGYEDLERIARQLLRALDEPFALANGDVARVSGSIGIALFPVDARDSQMLLKYADQAMYAAKDGGRNRFAYFTRSMQEEVDNRGKLTGDLRYALERRQLQVYYQPIIALGSGEISKAEALLRWNHPLRGLVGPGVFIPLAEESGLIHEIGDWVFREAIAAVKAWQERFGRRIQVGVNKSPVQFDKVVTPSWHDLVAEHGLPAGCINVEITEGSLLKESNHIQERLLELRDAGIAVSVDDFGTGFSALSYLHRFDIDYLKVDRSYVSELGRDPTSTALTEAIIAMAHKLGIKTVAEGVECERQHELLGRFGCDYAQGFLYSHPLPADEFSVLLEGGRGLAPVSPRPDSGGCRKPG